MFRIFIGAKEIILKAGYMTATQNYLLKKILANRLRPYMGLNWQFLGKMMLLFLHKGRWDEQEVKVSRDKLA